MKKIGLSIVALGVLALFFFSGCTSKETPSLATQGPLPTSPSTTPRAATQTRTLQTVTITPTWTPSPTQAEVTETPDLNFASYHLVPVKGKPALKQEPIDPQMGNVLVPLVLSGEQLEQLAEAGVVASPAKYTEFHVLYQETVRNNLPVFITSDALLHAYHLIFDQLLSTLEEEVFLPKLRQLNQALLEQARLQYEQLRGGAWEDPALRVYAYLSVGSRLADPDFQLPDAVSELAGQELSLVEAAGGPAPSPIFTHLKYGEDYSQYIPRSHYTKSEALKAYFKAMMWYGRMTFRLDDPEDPQAGSDETRMALLLALAIRDANGEAQTTLALWRLLYDPTAFLVGRSDDLTVEDYLQVMSQVYGAQASLSEVASDIRLQDFIAATDGLPAPRILGLISDDYKPLEAVKGLRLMGQRFAPDAYIFQELIHPKVPNRFLPSGLDVMAVMGSERAAGWMEQDPTTQNPAYASQLDRLTGWMESLSQDDWVETAYNSWLYTLLPLLDPPGKGYPLFMQSEAWQDKQLNTALGSWAEMKHDTLLYAKQTYAGLGGCGWPAPPAPVAAHNYVEPVPEVYARIAALAEMTRKGLVRRGLIELIPVQDEYAPTLGERLGVLYTKAVQFEAMAESELQGQPLTQNQEDLLRSFGFYLEDLVTWVNGDQQEQDPAALIADAATDPNTGVVLEVGIGNVHEIYAVAPVPLEDGSLALTVARGGIFSYYEFPSRERLTDEGWREMVRKGKAPDQPSFTAGFSVQEPASPGIQAAIYRFQRDWANWLYWTSGYNGMPGCARSPEFVVPVNKKVLTKAQKAIAALQAQNKYEGRQWISSDYLSAEPSADKPGNLIVTVRETWSDYLVTYAGSDPFAWYSSGEAEPVTARRGPYSIDVVYELQPLEKTCAGYPFSECYSWKIVRFEELTERPVWVEP